LDLLRRSRLYKIKEVRLAPQPHVTLCFVAAIIYGAVVAAVIVASAVRSALKPLKD
jgi:hypothetical protein